MKTVFIFGAGASRKAGAPLMFDFLDRADELSRGPSRPQAFEDVFTALAELQSIHAKSYLNLDNIETLFGAIEMARLIGKFGKRSREEIESLRDSLVNLIVQTIEQSMRFRYVAKKRKAVPPEPYGALISGLKEIYGKRLRQPDPPLSFISFNYDLALDYALHYNRVPNDYWLSASESSGCPLLKLHGSINWGTCDEEVIPYPVGAARFNAISDSSVLLDLGTNLSHYQHDGVALEGPPVIIPPTWNKGDYHGSIGRVWSKAAEELAAAENIFVIGYSLPETDSFFRYLFALGTDSSTRLKRLWVINPDYDGSVQERFRDMVGRGVRHRLKFINGEDGKFENAREVIVKELGGEPSRAPGGLTVHF